MRPNPKLTVGMRVKTWMLGSGWVRGTITEIVLTDAYPYWVRWDDGMEVAYNGEADSHFTPLPIVDVLAELA